MLFTTAVSGESLELRWCWTLVAHCVSSLGSVSIDDAIPYGHLQGLRLKHVLLELAVEIRTPAEHLKPVQQEIEPYL